MDLPQPSSRSLVRADRLVIQRVSGRNPSNAASRLLEEAINMTRGRGDANVITMLRRHGLTRNDHWPLYLFALALCVHYPRIGDLLTEPSVAGDASYSCFYCHRMFTYPGSLTSHVDGCADHIPPWIRLGLLHSLTVVYNYPETMTEDNRELARIFVDLEARVRAPRQP